MNFQSEARNLHEQGFAIVRTPFSKVTFAIWREIFIGAIFRNSQFFTSDAEDGVLGGFSAFATPDSFHHPFVRFLRLVAEWVMVPFFHIFMDLIGMKDANLQVLFDRSLFRRVGKVVAGESGHRDECTFADDGDHILGGWINLDDKNQYFHCVPKTHTGANKRGGFSRLSKEESKHFEAMKQTVIIPPGAILIFYENIVHFVANSKTQTETCRLFLGWRITYACIPMDPETEKDISGQRVPRIKSGQTPPMFAKLHITNHIEKLQDFSKKNIKKELLIHHTFKTGKHIGKPPFVICKRFIPSLEDLSSQFPGKFKLHSEYSEFEKNQMIPHKLSSFSIPIYE